MTAREGLQERPDSPEAVEEQENQAESREEGGESVENGIEQAENAEGEVDEELEELNQAIEQLQNVGADLDNIYVPAEDMPIDSENLDAEEGKVSGDVAVEALINRKEELHAELESIEESESAEESETGLEDSLDEIGGLKSKIEESRTESESSELQNDIDDLKEELSERRKEVARATDLESIRTQLESTLDSEPSSSEEFNPQTGAEPSSGEFDSRIEDLKEIQTVLSLKEDSITDQVADEIYGDLRDVPAPERDEGDIDALDDANDAYTEWKQNGAIPESINVSEAVLEEAYDKLQEVEDLKDKIDLQEERSNLPEE